MSIGRLLVLATQGNRSTVESGISDVFGESVEISTPLCGLSDFQVTHCFANFSGVRENCRELLLSVSDNGVPLIVLDLEQNASFSDLNSALEAWELRVYDRYQHLLTMSRNELEEIANGIEGFVDFLGKEISEATDEEMIEVLRQVWQSH